MGKIDNTNAQVKADIELAEITEYYILDLIKKNYPKAFKRPGNYKYHDIYIPELNYGIEIKNDLGNNDTGNLFIEYEYRNNSSGILTTNAKYWYQSNGKQIWVFRTDYLRDIYNTDEFKIGVMYGKKNGTKGMLLENAIEKYEEYIIHHIDKYSDAYYDYLIWKRKELIKKYEMEELSLAQ